MRTFTAGFVSFVVYLSGLGISAAHAYAAGDIRIENSWARPLPAVATNGVAYMTLHNRGDAPDRLLSASTPAARRAELHTHVHEDGMMRMRRIEAVEVPPGGSTVLEPGGLHLMLMGLQSPMSEGREFPLTLRFERAGTVEITVEVKKQVSLQPGDHDERSMNVEHGQHRQTQE